MPEPTQMLLSTRISYYMGCQLGSLPTYRYPDQKPISNPIAPQFCPKSNLQGKYKPRTWHKATGCKIGPLGFKFFWASPPCMGNPARPPRKAAPGPLHAAISTVATAQILRASGYSAAEPAALRTLSDITGHYIASLGRAAAALAEARGRTEPNVADVVLALEGHAQGGGFPGASDPARPVLISGALAELAGFVAAVREVPFAKALPRREPGGRSKRWGSFAAAGEEPPLRHVPRWLPRFPAGWENQRNIRGRRCEAEAKKGEEEDTGEVVAVIPANGDSVTARRRAVPEEREKVSFSSSGKKRRRAEPDRCHDFGGLEKSAKMKG
jgi:transcription initiation factor TFIID subunit 8